MPEKKKKEKEENVENIIRQAWSSLESHLPYTHKKSSEGKKFHKKCVEEYLDIINNSVKLW
jgi:hypothetical protein